MNRSQNAASAGSENGGTRFPVRGRHDPVVEHLGKELLRGVDQGFHDGAACVDAPGVHRLQPNDRGRENLRQVKDWHLHSVGARDPLSTGKTRKVERKCDFTLYREFVDFLNEYS